MIVPGASTRPVATTHADRNEIQTRVRTAPMITPQHPDIAESRPPQPVSG